MQKKILVVEDYEDLRSFMKVLIEIYGYNVVEAANGRESVESFRRQSSDLILMDFLIEISLVFFTNKFDLFRC